MHAKDAEIISAEGGSASFERLELLAEGRTADVLLVRDARPEREQVPLQLRIAVVTHQLPDTYALKIARDAPDEPLAARNERVTHEQDTLERLVHSGIVRSGTGGWHEGRAFFSMELLEGPGLARFLSHERRPYRDRMRLFLGVCEAIERCHARGIVHRDLRPSNITVEPDRGPVLFDFESSSPANRKECWSAARRSLRHHALDLAATALVLLAAWKIGMFHLRAHSAAVDERAAMVRVIAQLEAQLAAARSRPLSAVKEVVASGLKMPLKPDPKWLKPRADGNCYSPSNGELMQAAVVIRGACWGSGGKIDPTVPCDKSYFDAPPELESNPTLRHLRNFCFYPFLVPEPQAAK